MMKYTVKDEYKRFVTEPDLMAFRDRALSKPNGPSMFDSYLNARVQLQNDEALFKEMDPNSSSYGQVRDIIEKRRKLVQDAEETLGGPSTTLQKVVNAAKTVTIDPLEKAVDVLKNFLTAPSEGEADPSQEARKPSLWDLFGR